MSDVGIHSAPTQKRDERSEAEGGRKLTFTLAPEAIEQVVKLTLKRREEGKETLGIRIGLRGGGCDGFSYVFEWADKPAGPRDHVFEFDAPEGKKVNVFIDKKSMLYLAGTTLTYVRGLMGHGFKFENPNVKGSCGCGESVQF